PSAPAVILIDLSFARPLSEAQLRSRTTADDPAARSASECCTNVPPKKIEGAGKAGCPMHPQPRTQTKKRASVVATGSPKHSGLPCAMVYGLFRLSPVTGLFCHCRFAGIASRET